MKSIISRILSRIKPKSSYKSLNRISISGSAIKHNFAVFQKHKPHYTIIPVLKSNAYGHGIKQIAQIIESIAECRVVAVDSYPEYQVVYKCTNKDILIMGETRNDNYKLFDPLRTHFAVRSEQVIETLGKLNATTKVHIFINSGMNREGVKPGKPLEELVSKIKQYKNIHIVGIMSHLACADDIHSVTNDTQADLFHSALQYLYKQGIYPTFIHLEASSGMIHNIDHHRICTAGRLGIGLYGLDPLYVDGTISEFGRELLPAMDVYSTITSTQTIECNDIVGYSGTRKADHDQTICIFPFGYREGLDRGLSGAGWKVNIHNKYHEIIGRISMNYACCEGGEGNIGDTVHILSSQRDDENSAYAFYDKLGKIVYEIVKFDDKIKRIVV